MHDDQFRVLPGPDGGVRLLGRNSYEPVVLPLDGHDVPVSDLRPGYLVDADLDWTGEDPTVETLSIRRPTRYTFVDGADPIFEVARDLWEETRAAGDGMNSRVTRNTDDEVNGVVYVFAEGGPASRFGEFQDGTRPLEPLLDRVNDRDDPAPREVFVLRPPTGDVVVVAITLEKGGLFADTIRDTYDCSTPDEPLVE